MITGKKWNGLEITPAMFSLMKQLPTGTFEVPPHMRVFSRLEEAGLASYLKAGDGRNYIWHLTLIGAHALKEGLGESKHEDDYYAKYGERPSDRRNT